MTIRFLPLLLLPLIGISQTNAQVETPMGGNTASEKKPLEIKRNALYNLEEIKVRWKKAALENCSGVPCVVAPPAPSFACGTSTVLDFDENAYNTVSIGSQCWTVTNLKVTKYNDGSLILDLTSSTSNPWATSEARTEYVGVMGYVGTFGYLYNWYAVNDLRKLCPAGWHVPTDAEWTNLIQFIDPTASAVALGVQSSTAGNVMKSAATNSIYGTGLGWNPAGSPGTNISGFSALPGGFRDFVGSFNIRNDAYFWSATENGNAAWARYLSNSTDNVNRFYDLKYYGASVRCLRD